MDQPIVVTVVYPASIDVVWKAITVADEMRSWFFGELTQFEPTLGYETRFDVTHGERTFPHHWRITAIDPGTSMTSDWLYTGYPGAGEVTWELTPVADGTELTLTCRGITSFPQDIAAFQPAACRTGWEYFLRNRLAAYLG